MITFVLVLSCDPGVCCVIVTTVVVIYCIDCTGIFCVSVDIAR